ncbi:MAG TPA: S1 RNA-binding domain-containing protein [Anaerolineae bacterium]|nr:S1 RNA-binding domain-containing protein [Anaerolineae bacterium]HID83670.1 S1 RNA-binding domain-containing protein [Anaerolineales bacterium]HIQ08977.1 S1 RNA-binding domain-containing protein [Anaerolineaceae bacterium]
METQVLTAPERVQEPEVEVQRKQHFVGKIIHTTTAGAIVNIGLRRPAVVHISQLSPEPVKRVEDVVQVGQEVEVWVRRINPKGIIELTMIKPLDLEWREIKKGMVVKGKVERIDKVGVYVNIGAEVPGFVHISELSHEYVRHPSEVVTEGQEVEAKVIAVNRRRKQIKLSIKALLPKPEEILRELKEEEKKEAAKPKARKGARSSNGHKKEEAPVGETDLTPMAIALQEALERAKAEAAQATGKAQKAALKRVAELESLLAATRGHARLN